VPERRLNETVYCPLNVTAGQMFRRVSADGEIDRLGALAALVRLGLEGNFLSVLKTGKARSLNGRDVDENVLGTIVRRDETEAFGVIEEFYGAAWDAPL
jgi:hypothetical protein